jgi:phosphohistidine phosphatase SixA
VSLYLVRHARAGSRQRWQSADDLRPLSKVGRKQAAGIARARSRSGITRVFSSPFVRCRETVEPLAGKLGLEIELSDALAEGAPVAQTLRLVEKLLDQDAALCTHGDVLGNVLEHYASTGVRLRGNKLEKASTWVLKVVAGEVVATRYVPPPAT